MLPIPKKEEILTVPNIMTVVGGYLAWQGAEKAGTLPGLVQTGFARSIDTLDGVIARATGAETDFGAILDVTTDKIATSKYLFELYNQNLAPKIVIGSIAVRSAINAAATTIAAKRSPEQKLRPTASGKLGIAAETLSLLAFNAEYVARQADRPKLAKALRGLGWTAFAIAAPLALHASATYVNRAINHQS